jgi:hypothetical protein
MINSFSNISNNGSIRLNGSLELEKRFDICLTSL